MKLEVGKKYELNNGKVVSCDFMIDDDPLHVDYYGFGPFVLDGIRYHQDGRWADYGPDDELSVKREYVPEPKLWRDMTDAEKGALLLAKHEGKVIEYWGGDGWWSPCNLSSYNLAYRVKPEPKVETLDMSGKYHFGGITLNNNKYRITLQFIDGKPDLSSIKMEEL